MAFDEHQADGKVQALVYWTLCYADQQQGLVAKPAHDNIQLQNVRTDIKKEANHKSFLFLSI